MDAAFALCTIGCNGLLHYEAKCPNFKIFKIQQYLRNDSLKVMLHKYPRSNPSSRIFFRKVNALPGIDNFFWEKEPTPLLDTIEAPIHLKNLSLKELKQLASEVRSEISFLMSKSQLPFKSSLSVVELTIAIHRVFNAPMDKILWDVGEQAYAHKILTGRRSMFHRINKRNGISGFTSRLESEYDPFSSGHGCNSISAGLGMAVARDIDGKKNRVVTVISNWTTLAGQSYEAMSNAGYLDSDMIVILNDSRHSLLSKPDQIGPKSNINALSSALTKIQSSKSFRKFRETAKGFTKWIGKGIHELAAKVDEYARGLIGPPGSTLFEELGLYYIGPIDGNNIQDLMCVLNEVSSLDSTGPVLVHVITENKEGLESDSENELNPKKEDPSITSQVLSNFTFTGVNSNSNGNSDTLNKSYDECFAESLLAEAERDPHIVVIQAGAYSGPALRMFRNRFPDRYFDVGMAEQHAVTFAAGLACSDFKPFCVIPSTFLQRAYDQVIQDVDKQRLPVRFAITDAGLVGPDGLAQCGSFDIAFMSSLPNMIVMAPSDQAELINMVATAVSVNDRPVCFRFPRSSIVGTDGLFNFSTPLEIGKGEILVEGKDVALLGYGIMVQNCLKAQSLLASLGIEVTVANARFCKPLDLDLIRDLCRDHEFIITVEEGTIGGFGSHVSQLISLDGLLDCGRVKWRPIVLPDKYIEQASPREQFEMAGLTGHHIAATALSLLGRNREALLLMR